MANDVPDSVLAPIAGSGEASSSLVVADPAIQADLPYVLQELYRARVHEQLVRLGACPNMNHAAVHMLADTGHVYEERTEFGEVEVRLNLDRLQQSVHMIVGAPVHAIRVSVKGSPSKPPKMMLMLRLREMGWGSGEPDEDLGPDSQLIYKESLARPLAYFIALLEREKIFEKVYVIKRGGSGYYYRCLLSMEEERLALFDLYDPDQDNNWWKQQFQQIQNPDPDGDGDLSDDSHEDGGRPCGGRQLFGRPPIEAPADASVPLAPVATRENAPWWETEWKRCWVT